MHISKQAYRIGALALSLFFVPFAGAVTPTNRFLHEEAFCFQQGKPLPGGWNVTYKLSGSPLSAGNKNQIVGVHALERGVQVTSQVNSYSNQLVGTATLTNANAGPGETIQIALVGTSFGTNGGVDTGLWTFSYSLQLNKTSLNGRILGIKQFAAIANGAPTATPVTSYVDDTLTLMDACPSGL